MLPFHVIRYVKERILNPATRILISVITIIFIVMFAVIYVVRGNLLEERRKETAFYDEAVIPQEIIPLTLTSDLPYRVFGIKELENNFDQITITTRTYFTGNEIHTFTGPRVMDILNAYSADIQNKTRHSEEISFWSKKAVIAAAGDDYDIRIPVSGVFERFNPIIATKMDGTPLPDEYAPLFIVFNRDGIGELDDSYTQYWVWALTRMHIAPE